MNFVGVEWWGEILCILGREILSTFLPECFAQAEKNWQSRRVGDVPEVLFFVFFEELVCFLQLYVIIWSQQLRPLQWDFKNVTKIYWVIQKKNISEVVKHFLL